MAKVQLIPDFQGDYAIKVRQKCCTTKRMQHFCTLLRRYKNIRLACKGQPGGMKH